MTSPDRHPSGTKVVVPGPPGTLPASFTASVVCDDGTTTKVTLPGTGGAGTPLLTVASGAVCAVGEDTTGLPAGTTVFYSINGGPASSSPPVFTVTGASTVTVTITNNASAVTTTTSTTAPPTTPPPTLEPTGVTTIPGTLPPPAPPRQRQRVSASCSSPSDSSPSA